MISNYVGIIHSANAADGSQYVILQYGFGYNSGGISQSFPTKVGSLYEVTFDYAALAEGGTRTWDLTANIAGTPLTLPINETGTPGLDVTPWVEETVFFTATATTSTISFTGDTHDQYYGPVLDDVTAEFIPEPATLTLLLAGGGVIFWLLRRRSQTSA